MNRNEAFNHVFSGCGEFYLVRERELSGQKGVLERECHKAICDLDSGKIPETKDPNQIGFIAWTLCKNLREFIGCKSIEADEILSSVKRVFSFLSTLEPKYCYRALKELDANSMLPFSRIPEVMKVYCGVNDAIGFNRRKLVSYIFTEPLLVLIGFKPTKGQLSKIGGMDSALSILVEENGGDFLYKSVSGGYFTSTKEEEGFEMIAGINGQVMFRSKEDFTRWCRKKYKK